MRRHPPAWLAWPLAAVSLGAIAAAIAAVWLWPGLLEAAHAESAVAYTVEAVWLVGAPVVGAVVASRRPDHAYGWLLISLGVVGAGQEVASAYGMLALLVHPGALPFGWPAAWLSDLAWGAIVLHLPFLFLLFPDGRLPSPRWRWLVRAIVGLAALMYPAGILQPGQLGTVPVDNPIGVGDAAAALVDGVLYSSGYVLFAATALAATSVFVRRRTAGPQERLQLRWFAYAAGLFAVIIAVGIGAFLVDLPAVNATVPLLLADALPLLLAVAFNAMFAAIGVAVLRYRLYEIDRIVSRTVSYALLTGVLAGVYVTSVLLLSRLLAPLGAGSELAVAAATLAAAAIFGPARRRIQHAVDRRFNRARYDAEQVVAGFRERLRGAVDLDAVGDELQAAARVTVAPSAVSLWLPDGQVKRSHRDHRAQVIRSVPGRAPVDGVRS